MKRETTVWLIIDSDGKIAKSEPFNDTGALEIHDSFSSADQDKMSDETVIDATLTWED